MHRLLQREFVSRADCRKLLDQVDGLSRREASALSGHLTAIFDRADDHPHRVTSGIFTYEAAEQKIPVRFKRVSGGNPACSISTSTLFMLAPSLAQDKAPEAKPAESHGRLSYVALSLKTKDELGPEWKTFSEACELLRDEAKRLGKNLPLNKYARAYIGRLAEEFTGEMGTVHGIECRKYNSYNRMTVAIHEASIPQLLTYLEHNLQRSGHRSVQSRLNNQGAGFER